MSDEMTLSTWIKIPYTDGEKIDLANQIVEAEASIIGTTEELKGIQDEYKDKIKGFQVELHECASKYRKGYEEVQKECFVKYDGDKAIFTDKETGEILEERELTEAEQMRLSGKIVDAEDVIRQASEED
jgi:hypothetical protein